MSPSIIRLPNGIHLPTGRTQAGLDTALGQGIIGRIPNQAYGYSQQWNLALERALDRNSTATVAYAGSKGTHLVLSLTYTGTGLNLNQLPDGSDSLGRATAETGRQSLLRISSFGYNDGLSHSRRRLPPAASPAVPRRAFAGRATRRRLHLSCAAGHLHSPFSHAGTLQGAYTWAKLLSNTESTSAFQDRQGGLGVVQDNYNLKAEKSVSEQDVANNLVINYGLDLPFGHGEAYLSKIGSAANAMIGGWRMNGITNCAAACPSR